MTTILGYSYDATICCPDCARLDQDECRLVSAGRSGARLDMNGLMEDLEDRAGNPVRPVFSTDEGAASETCGACFDRLA